MNFLTSTIAAVSTTAILSGSAQAQVPVDEMISTLRLPVGTPTQYYNAATQAVIQETCNIVDARNVACDVRVLGAAAMVDFMQRGMVYKIGEDGNITVDPGEFVQESWDTEIDGGLYRQLMAKGMQASWTASSPLAQSASDGTIIQNNIRKTALRGDRSYATSDVPISDSRGLSLTQSFEDRSPAHVSVVMKIIQGGAVVETTGGRATRPFIESDYNDYVVKYYEESLKPYGIAAP